MVRNANKNVPTTTPMRKPTSLCKAALKQLVLLETIYGDCLFSKENCHNEHAISSFRTLVSKHGDTLRVAQKRWLKSLMLITPLGAIRLKLVPFSVIRVAIVSLQLAASVLGIFILNEWGALFWVIVRISRCLWWLLNDQ